jgi:type II secretory pathway pseudopilin PulG
MSPCRRTAAFTLVEMLVSVAVLVLLILLISQLFNSATATATISRKHIDADEAAAMVFDQMAIDFSRMPRRADVNYVFYKNTAGTPTSGSSDAMFFYADAPGVLSTTASNNFATTGSASSMALVGYRINQYNPVYNKIPVMERLGETLTWAGTPDSTGTFPGGAVFLPTNFVPTSGSFAACTLPGNWTFTLGQPPYNGQANQGDTLHYQVLSDMVFRLEVCFLLKSGTYAVPGGGSVTSSTSGYSNAPTALSGTTATPSTWPYITNNYFAPVPSSGGAPDLPGNVYGYPPDLAGIVVTIAVLDKTSRKMVSSGGLATLAAALPDSLNGSTTTLGQNAVVPVPQNAQLPAEVWQSDIITPGFAGMPQAALSQVRIFEHTFYLSPN